MNRVFKSLWNPVTGTWVAVSEIISSKGAACANSSVGHRQGDTLGALKTFRIKPLLAALSMGFGGLVLSFSAGAIVTETVTADTDVGTMHLTQGSLGNSVLGNPSQLQTGSNAFKYVTVNFRPTESGTYVFGQTSSPVDTVMIAYSGGFDPTAPGIGAIVGNDDTPESTHRTILGAAAPTIIQCGPSTGYCPQITMNVEAGKVYTLLVSVYNSSYNTQFTVPFDFYSNRDGEFKQLSEMTPIDTNQANSSRDLDFLIRREFKGGVLSMDLANGTYALSFTVHGAGDFAPSESNRIEQNGNVSVFSGVLRDFDTNQGALTIINSGTGGKVVFSGDNTYSGGTTIDVNALLSIARDSNLGAATGGLTFTGGKLENTAAMTSARNVTLGTGGGTFDTIANLTLNGAVTSINGGSLTKTGAATLTLGNANSVVEQVDVEQGKLAFTQNGTFTVVGDYTTASGAETQLGGTQSYLNVGNTFKQESGSTLTVNLNNSTQPEISARDANLSGTIALGGVYIQPPKASLINDDAYRHVIIHTTNGITGDFTNTPVGPSSTDYLLQKGFVNGNDYVLGTLLAWTDGGQAEGTGTFTMGAGTQFDVDIALSNQTPPGGGFNSGWNGQSLTKNGAGLLILSASNLYTGTTTLNAGELRTDTDNTFQSSQQIAVNGGTLNLNGSSQIANSLSGTGGTVDLNGSAALTANNATAAQNSAFAGIITGNGTLTKTGTGELTLTGANTYTGQTTISSGVLNIGNGGTQGSIVSNVANNATLTFNRSDTYAYAGLLSGNGTLNKQGTGTLSLTHSNSIQGDVNVQAGTLALNQNGTFTATGDFTTSTGATTRLGTQETYLNVQGTFTQVAGSILDVTLNANGNPDIIALNAHLDGIVSVNGFNARPNPVKASEATANNYTFIRTTNGIGNDFDNNPIGSYGIDYLLHEGFVNGNDYELGFHLTWLADATEGHGDFTVNANTSFDVDIALNNQSNTYSSGWDGRSLMKDGEGLLVLSANNLYTGTTTLKAGELRTDINNAFGRSEQTIIQGGTLNLHATSQTVNNLSGTGGSVDIAGGTLSTHNTSDTVYQGAILDTAGTGQFIKTGAASLTLQGQTSWTGATLLEGGQLILDGTHGGAQLVSNIQAMNGTQLRLQNGASLTGIIDPTDVTIDSSSTWNMTGDSVVNHMNLAGTVNIAPPSANTFKTLTVEGNYTGQNGLIVFNGQLGEDTSPIDKLNIQGNTSGTTRVQVNNAGGRGAQTLNGIELITVQGQSDGEFVQSGRIVAGAYDYELARGNGSDAGNWYLSSYRSYVPQPIRRPEAGSYASNVAAAASLFNLRWQDHSQRYADIDPATGTYKLSGIWLHSQGAHTRHRDDSGQLHTRSNRSVVQLGADIIELNNDNGRTTVGVMGGYGSHRSTTRSQVTGHASTGRVEGYNLGVYGSWEQHPQENRGWYVDSWAHYSWLDNTVSGYALPTETYNADGLTASLEAGYTFKVGENETSKASYYVQPQAQLIWMGSKSGDHREINGTLVRMQGQNTVQSRVGMKAFMQTRHGATPFVEGNWIHNNAQAGANLDGINVYQAGGHNVGEVRIGVEGQISRNVSASGKLEHRMGERNYRDTALSVEVKVNF